MDHNVDFRCTKQRLGKAIVSAALVSLSGCLPPEQAAVTTISYTYAITGSVTVLPLSLDLRPAYQFGLYTTVLLTQHDRSRNFAFYDELSKLTPTLTEYGAVRELRNAKELNAFFFPAALDRLADCLDLTDESGEYRQPSEQASQAMANAMRRLYREPSTRTAARELLYDYDLAQRFMQRFELNKGRGPFLVTYKNLLTNIDQHEKGLLVADLSTVDKRNFSQYIRLYLDQVKRPEYWDAEHLDDWQLQLSQLIAKIDTSLSGSLQSVASVIRVAQAKEEPKTSEPPGRIPNPTTCKDIKPKLAEFGWAGLRETPRSKKQERPLRKPPT